MPGSTREFKIFVTPAPSMIFHIGLDGCSLIGYHTFAECSIVVELNQSYSPYSTAFDKALPEAFRKVPPKVLDSSTLPEAELPMSTRDAAYTFMDACGLDPSADAVDQLVESFLPALMVMCRRGYDPDGETWRAGGWRGLLHEMRKKTDRLLHRSWLHGRYDPDSALDLMNYAGFYYRLKNAGQPWGDLGEPGSAGPNVDQVSMGDYSSVTAQPDEA
jgi:hypothetical protein